MQSDGGESAPFAEAAEVLLARRRSQRGLPTYGDAQDRMLALSLTTLPGPERPDLVREYGLLLGRHVLARRFFEDTLRGAFIVASTTLMESGWGALQVDDVFHRSARVAFRPQGPMEAAPPKVLGLFVAGLLEGYLSEAFNCEASVEAEGLSFQVELGEGRDVNRRRTGL